MLGSTIDKVANWRLADIPVGKALLILAAIGLGKGVSDLVYSKWPTAGKYTGLVVGGGLALASKKIAGVRNFLGDTGAETLAIGGAAAAILSIYDVQGWIESKLAGISIPSTTVPASTAGAATSGSVGNPEEYLSDVERKAASIRRAAIS